jgi:hypothetical protein
MILQKKRTNRNSLIKFFKDKNITIKKIGKKEKNQIYSNIEREIKEKKFSSVTSSQRLNVWNLAWNNSIKYKNIYIPNYLSKIDILRICGDYYRYTKKLPLIIF